MWADAQRDGRPTEYSCRPLFNAAKFRWRPLLECRAVTLPRRESRWNLHGCPKLPNRSQPLVAEVHHIIRTCRGGKTCYCLTIFPVVDTCLLRCKNTAQQVVRWCRDGDFLAIFLRPLFSASRVQYISDLHSKFALRPHNVCKLGRHPVCDGWD